ncbi:SigE family RNA polymerase sigma factor [Kribbella sp. NPDC051770]|uniref:SigE family RNA polymerase sigma factor n=1 Tax=Kribbella sp. NPDC051770 TaxID=3155413 RepID=UPI00342D4A98
MTKPDRVEFEDFVSTRYGGLLRTAYLLTQDRALAEDLVQTTLARCWLIWQRIDDPSGYVHRTMVNTYTAWWRRRWNGEYPTEELPQHGADGGQGGVEISADLSSALRRLPRRMRAVVVLRFYEDLSEAETARILGCSVGTVKSQTSRALAKLRIDPAVLDHALEQS